MQTVLPIKLIFLSEWWQQNEHREIPNTILVLQITNFFTIELIGTWIQG